MGEALFWVEGQAGNETKALSLRSSSSSGWVGGAEQMVHSMTDTENDIGKNAEKGMSVKGRVGEQQF